MKEVIDIATNHLCATLGFELEEAKSLGKGFYGSSIPVFKGDEEYHFYLFFKEDTLKKFASVYFGSKLSEVDLDDVCKEIANQIIGKAKNVLNDTGIGNYRLGTPEFLGEVDNFNIELDEQVIRKIENRTFLIGYKKI
ncbi:MAG: chemotaxis protein CheX [Campylobacter sp.]|nr:chemotaxis protein CheX [Campylobacter sp.]